MTLLLIGFICGVVCTILGGVALIFMSGAAQVRADDAQRILHR